MNYSYRDLNILFEDDNIIVVRKPAGVPSESAEVSRPDMVRLLKNYLAPSGKEPYVALVHRLDQPVEGIMIFARTREAASALSKDIRDSRFKKDYLAACHPSAGGGYVLPDACEDNAGVMLSLENYLLKSSGNMVTVVSSDTPGAKKARLTYTPLRDRYFVKGTDVEARLIRISLITGRHHQIRVQLSHTGLPIIGDRKYGCIPGGYNGPLCLAAVGLTFIHPQTHKSMHFEITPGFIDVLEGFDEAVDDP